MADLTFACGTADGRGCVKKTRFPSIRPFCVNATLFWWFLMAQLSAHIEWVLYFCLSRIASRTLTSNKSMLTDKNGPILTLYCFHQWLDPNDIDHSLHVIRQNMEAHLGTHPT
jgi:hypothetical protein